MALIKPIHGQMSGSIAGNTYAHNKGGQYVRQRVVPTNPNTADQSQVRSVFAALAAGWSTGLTPTLRAAWDLFAANVPKINRLGDPVFTSGINWFIAVNALQFRVGGSFITAAPTTFALADLTQPSVSFDVATQLPSVSFTEADPWVSEDGAFLFIQMGRPVSGGVNFFRGPFRVTSGIAGDATTPPTTPQQPLSPPFVVSAGQSLFYRFTAIRADGRPSAPTIVKATLT